MYRRAIRQPSVLRQRLIAQGVGRRAWYVLASVVVATFGIALSAAPYRLNPEEQRQLDSHARGASPRLSKVNVMRPAAVAMALVQAKENTPVRWSFEGNSYSVDDYFERHPVAAVLIAKDGQVVFERYQFGVTAQTPYLANSMAKSLIGLAMGFAKTEGKIVTFDVPLNTYVTELSGFAYGDISVGNLMRMGSGMRYRETYEPGDESTKFRDAARRDGIINAAKLFADRDAAQGTRFNYASIETSLVGAALKRATGESVSSYLQPRLWQAIGAEGEAQWQVDQTGLEWAQCCLFAFPRDYLRLGIVLANDGVRPDTGQTVIPKQYLLETTDWRKLDAPFQPKRAGSGYSSYGYNNFFWLQGGDARRFILLGVHGQAIFVDPAKKLVMVHLAANSKANVTGTAMGNERAALWRGVVQTYGR
jgi:CubicO group peptidase (beta-lactamase class C family)